MTTATRTHRTAGLSAEQRRARQDELLAALADGVLELTTSQGWRRYLRAMATLRTLRSGAEWIMLDNMSIPQLRDVVAHRHLATTPNVVLEASGTTTLPTARAIAETGVNALSVGAPTHSAPALDLSMQLQP